ncbi:MAG: hypothetical protein QOF48_999 [Verrucomicrobiota bacterium]|jgi:2-polyprenyl-6-methoxyphenol hydroxylase-like FAD-dependent oxidoreductase
MAEAITIVGGGLAGLTLGIALRRCDVPVIIREAANYPRHRVCGEFISGQGQRVLDGLGLLKTLRESGAAVPAARVAFYNADSRLALRALPQPALCISRFVLDEFLARQFQRLGGKLNTDCRWVDGFGPGTVRATGRRIEPAANGWRLFGLKVHASQVALDADLEMHFVPDGYVGICRLPGSEVNICGLFRSGKAVPDLGIRWRDWLGGVQGSILRRRLEGALMDESSFCSVAGLSLRPHHAGSHEECCIGDALTMIPPVTGNGMSMALESADLAAPSLVRFSRGELAWAEARHEIASCCDRRFAGRLRWSAWLQQALFQKSTRAVLLFVAARSETLWRRVFEHTR